MKKIFNFSDTFTRKDFFEMYTRSCTLDCSWNYERMQNLSYAYMMTPVIKRLYETEEERKKALQRHLEFMSVTPHICTILVGVSAALEKENKNKKDFDTNTINAVKASLMGPLAGIGDSFFWGTLKLIAAGIGISLAKQGNILGPLVFFLIINIPAFLARYYGLKLGYEYGTKIFTNNNNKKLIDKITYSASMIGLMVIGAMIATMINIDVLLNVGTGDFKTPIQQYLNEIMPALLPMGVFLLFYKLLGKKVKTTTILISLIIFSIVMSYFNIL